MISDAFEGALHISSRATVSDSTVIRGGGSIYIDSFVTIEDHVVLDLGRSGVGEIHIGPRSKLKYGCIVRCYNGRFEIGRRSTVGEYAVVLAHGGVSIGNDVGIASHCSIAASSHIRAELADPFRYQGETAEGISIGNDVWIGTGVRILDGVCIGNQATIGAGSVVTRTMPAQHLCVGTPCVPIHKLESLSYVALDEWSGY